MKKLFENVGGNRFKLSSEAAAGWDFNEIKAKARLAFGEYQKQASFQLSSSDKDSFIDGFTEGYLAKDTER